MNPFIYKPLFLHLVVILSLILARQPAGNMRGPANAVSERTPLVWLSLVLTLFLGLRPVSWAFGDTINYARFYNSALSAEIDWSGDWLFYLIMEAFRGAGFSVNVFFLFVETVYIGCTCIAVYRLFPRRPLAAFAFVLAAFSFYSYGVNGIRNGMACALFFLSLSYVKEQKWLLAVLFSYASFSVHKSLLLPVGALVLARYYGNTKVYAAAWGVCIVLSLVVGDFVEVIFQNAGFIDTGRSMDYLSNSGVDMNQFSQKGFRWDFLLYSMVPIWVGMYFVKKKHYHDKFYQLMLNTYIVSNSFWVLVNRSWLSNRVAFLSWFMYGLVVMYPLLQKEYVQERKKKLSMALCGNAAFTYVMWLLGKYM